MARSYLMLAGNLMAGLAADPRCWAAESHRDSDPTFMDAKVATARFYAEHILPRTAAVRDAIVGWCRERRGPAAGCLLNAAMSLPAVLSRLRLPVIGSPLFIISNLQLVVAQCKAGIVGSMPRAQCTARWSSWTTGWLRSPRPWRARPRPPGICPGRALCHQPDRPQDVTAWARPGVCQVQGAAHHHQPRRPRELNQAVHGWGGLVLHDIINNSFAHKTDR